MVKCVSIAARICDKRVKSNYEELLALHIAEYGMPEPVRHYRFHQKRQWEFDFAWPELMIAVEVEGGIWSRGRHTRGSGFQKDIYKYNEATRLGWELYRFSTGDVNSMKAINFLWERICRLKSTSQLNC